MSKIFLKGEKHYSKKDLEKEVDLLENENIGAIVDEGSKYSYKINLKNFWYAVPIHIFLCVRSPLDQPRERLYELAKDKGIIPQRTRRNDLEIYEDAKHKALPWIVSILILVFFGIFFYIIPTFLSFFLLEVAVLIIFPAAFVYFLRRLNMDQRNLRIARKIEKEHEEHEGDTLAILGNNHVDGIKRKLKEIGIRSENIDAEKTNGNSEPSIFTRICCYLSEILS